MKTITNNCCASLADPTYMIRAIPSNASDNVYCTLLAHSVIHGAMAGYTGFTVGSVNGRHAYIPFHVSLGYSSRSWLSFFDIWLFPYKVNKTSSPIQNHKWKCNTSDTDYILVVTVC